MIDFRAQMKKLAQSVLIRGMLDSAAFHRSYEDDWNFREWAKVAGEDPDQVEEILRILGGPMTNEKQEVVRRLRRHQKKTEKGD